MAENQRSRFILSSLVFLGVGLAATGCAAGQPGGALARGLPTAERGDTTAGEARVFATIEDAVHDAFRAVEDKEGPADRDRMRLGTIRRVGAGFSWTFPVRSSGTVSSMAPMQVRFRLGPDDVAVYAVHPRSGNSELDQLNESVGRGERRLVDEKDPIHRPVFVRTPSRRTLRYPASAAGDEAVEVVRRE